MANPKMTSSAALPACMVAFGGLFTTFVVFFPPAVAITLTLVSTYFLAKL